MASEIQLYHKALRLIHRGIIEFNGYTEWECEITNVETGETFRIRADDHPRVGDVITVGVGRKYMVTAVFLPRITQKDIHHKRVKNG